MSEDAHLCAWLALESGYSYGRRALLEQRYEDLYFNYYGVFYVLALAERAALDALAKSQEIHLNGASV